jgi:hypothetical protein
MSYRVERAWFCLAGGAGCRKGIDSEPQALYDIRMGYRLETQELPEGYVVTLRLPLTREESNSLFLAGDAMVSWPTDGLKESGDPRLSRSSIFASEIAASTEGLALCYSAKDEALRAATLLGLQLEQIGIDREDE